MTANTPSLWQNLVTTALVGTAKQPVALASSESEALNNFLAHLDPQDPERALLSAAAIVSLRRRAGQVAAVNDDPLPEPCDLDDLPLISARAGSHLSAMLSGTYKQALPEWLAEAIKAGQRVRDELLPAIM